MKNKATWFILAGLIFLLAAGLVVYLGYSYQIVGKKVAQDRQQKSKKPPKKTSPSTGTQAEQPTTGTGEWVTYANQRYGFRVDYPKNWQARESQNADGITLTVPDENGVVFRVYGFPTTVFSLAKLESDREASERAVHSDLSVVDKKEITVDGRPAIETIWTFTAVSADSPRTGSLRMHIVLAIKGEAGYAAEYVAEESVYSRFDTDFSNMVSSFKLK